jgi:SAM-dependent methyltransferase
MLTLISETFYPGLNTFGLSPIDGTLQFYSKINQLMAPDSVVLDFGAGRGAQLDEVSPWKRDLLLLKPNCVRRIGCDIDEAVLQNRHLSESYILQETSNYDIPKQNNSVDLAIADWVLEHLPQPLRTFQEIHRVVKPEGWFCARTGNLLHYSYATAYLLSNRAFSKRFLSKAQPHRLEEDVFPKFFFANSIRRLKKLARATGFKKSLIYSWEPEPGYLSFHSAAYLMGVAYQRFATFGLLPKATLLLFCQK